MSVQRFVLLLVISSIRFCRAWMLNLLFAWIISEFFSLNNLRHIFWTWKSLYACLNNLFFKLCTLLNQIIPRTLRTTSDFCSMINIMLTFCSESDLQQKHNGQTFCRFEKYNAYVSWTIFENLASKRFCLDAIKCTIFAAWFRETINIRCNFCIIWFNETIQFIRWRPLVRM